MVSAGRTAIPIDLLASGCLGLVFAACAADRLRLDGSLAQPSLTIVALFALLLVVPSRAYLYLAHPGWSFLYAVAPGALGPGGRTGLALVPGVVLVGAYLGGARLVAAGWRFAPWIVALLLAVVAGTVSFVLRGRLGRYGTYDQFHDGQALPLSQVHLAVVLVIIAVAVLSGAALVAHELWRDGRRAAGR